MAPGAVRLDPAQALAYAQALAQPRRVGTAANDQAIAELASQLRSFGCAVEVAPFEFSSVGEAALVYVVLAAQILILITFWTWGLSAWLAVPPAAVLAALLLASGHLYRLAARAALRPRDVANLSRARRWWLARGRVYRTANIIAQVPSAPGGAARPPFLLVAHSDSKSQAMSLPARMGLVGLASLAAVIFAGLSLLRTVAPGVTAAAAVAGLTALLAGVPLLFVLMAGSGNASPGAIDNASGAGLVLHLAEYLCANPPARPVTVLIAGAEEMGLLGALAYVRDVGVSGLRGASVLNFDGIGTAGRLALVSGGGGLEAAVRSACRQLNFPVGRLPLVGAQFDHLPFADAGIDAVSLVTAGWAALRVHTPNDNTAQLNVEGFRQGGAVALKVLEALNV